MQGSRSPSPRDPPLPPRRRSFLRPRDSRKRFEQEQGCTPFNTLKCVCPIVRMTWETCIAWCPIPAIPCHPWVCSFLFGEHVHRALFFLSCPALEVAPVCSCLTVRMSFQLQVHRRAERPAVAPLRPSLCSCRGSRALSTFSSFHFGRTGLVHRSNDLDTATHASDHASRTYMSRDATACGVVLCFHKNSGRKVFDPQSQKNAITTLAQRGGAWLTRVGEVRGQLPEGHLHGGGLGVPDRAVEVEQDGHLVEGLRFLHDSRRWLGYLSACDLRVRRPHADSGKGDDQPAGHR